MVKKFMPRKPDPIKLTQEGYNQAKKDLKELTKHRKKVLVDLQTAREMGDLSENGAYTAARQKLGITDRKLRHVKRLLRWGVVIKNKKDGKIDFDSKVILDNSENKQEYHLVSGFESDPSKKKLSVFSPLGKALIGKKAGDQITVSAPAGDITYKIISVL